LGIKAGDDLPKSPSWKFNVSPRVHIDRIGLIFAGELTSKGGIEPAWTG
jgi:hypothetical protein